MRIARSGRARISMRRPRAIGESDRSGLWYNHAQLRRQFQWTGNELTDTGLLVGPDELDIPQDQFRSPILPPDPLPIINPRPSPNTTGVPIIGQPLPTTPGNFGFSQYVLNSSVVAYPMTKAGVLSLVAQYSGIPTPGLIMDRSTVIKPGNLSQPLFQAQPARNWMIFYNPSVTQTQLSLALMTTWGASYVNLILGPGEAYFWSTDQQLGQAYQGAVSIIALYPGVPFWAWESAGNVVLATDEWGNIVTDENGAWVATDLPGPQTGFQFYSNGGLLSILPGGAGPWPPIDINLPPSAIWDNGLSVSFTGDTALPDPNAPPVYFGSPTHASISPDELLALGARNLPFSPGPPGSGLIYRNNGGFPGSGGTLWVS
jgi:hypothetical protein